MLVSDHLDELRQVVCFCEDNHGRNTSLRLSVQNDFEINYMQGQKSRKEQHLFQMDICGQFCMAVGRHKFAETHQVSATREREKATSVCLEYNDRKLPGLSIDLYLKSLSCLLSVTIILT